MLSTKLCILGAAAIAVCKIVVAQNGMVVGEATLGMMDDTFTIPADEWDRDSPPQCTAVMAGCSGELSTLEQETGGTITVVDDCTFRISQYTFTGQGPAVEWWASKQAGDPAVFPYPTNAIKVAELGTPGNYQAGGNVAGGASEVIVRLGLAEDGSQIQLGPDLDHISLWCEDYMVDFGNAALECDDAAAPGPLTLEPEAAPPAGKPSAAGAEAEAEGAAGPAEGEAKPEAEGAAEPAAEGEAKPEAEGAAEPAAEGEAKPEAEGAKPEAEGAAEKPAEKPATEPIMAPEPEAEAPSVPPTAAAPPPAGETLEEEETEEGASGAGDSAVSGGDVDSSTVEASGAAGAAQLVSAGAIVAGAAVLLL